MQQIRLKPANIIQPIFRVFGFDPFMREPITLNNKFTRWRKVANIIGLSDKAKLKIEWIIFYETVGNHDAYVTAKHFGIVPKTFYKWFNRFMASRENARTLEEQSKRPKHTRHWEVTPLEEARTVKLRKAHMRWGKHKLKRLYLREYGEIISAWKIERVIRLYKLYPDQKKAAKTALKIKKAKANPKKRIIDLVVEQRLWFLIHLDTIVLNYGNLKRYILSAVDHNGKFAYARMYRNKSSKVAKDFLYRLHYVLQEQIPNAQTDNGSEFKGEFDQALTEMNTLHWYSRVRTPEDNAEVERFHETLEYEWLNDGHFNPDCQVFNKELTEWLIEYNFVRPHQSLDYLTPIEYIEKVQQEHNILLPMYPARTRSLIRAEILLLLE